MGAFEIVFGFLILALLISSMVWIVKDAVAHGKDGLIIGLLAFFTWPFGHLFWIVARPNEKKKIKKCKRCGSPLSETSGKCPNCFN